MKPKKIIWKIFPSALLYLAITFVCTYFIFSYFLVETFQDGTSQVQLPEAFIDSELLKIRFRSLIIATFVSLTGFFFFFWSTLKVTIPLGSILKVARAISRGDLDMKIPLSYMDSQEVQGLQKYLTRMGQQLKDNSESLEKKEAEQAALLAAMDEGVLSVGLDKKVLHINMAMRRFLGLSMEATFRGKTLVEVCRIPKLIEYLDHILNDGNFIKEEFSPDSKNFFQVQGGALYSQDEKLLGAFLVFHDMTEIKTLERYRKEFVSNISHELRTPITAIQGYLETITEGKVDDPELYNKFMNIVSKQANRLGHIVEDLLNLSRIETGNLEFEWQELRPLILSAVDICKERAAKKGITIETHIEKTLSAKVNQSLLQQGLVNLIDNAIKYSPANTKILVSLRQLDDAISLDVTDQGPGIAPEHHDRLFERFYSVDKARSKELGGSGIGLAIVKHIARAHGGREGVTSTLGAGSTFSIIL